MAAYDDTKFRQQFPAFSDATKWPEPMLSMYWEMARIYISTTDSQWNCLNGASLQLSVDLMCAHLSSLAADEAASGNAGTPGAIDTSASVGSVSVSTLPPPASDTFRYWLSQTSYGQQLLTLLSIKAVGGLYIGGLPERQGFRKAGGVFW